MGAVCGGITHGITQMVGMDISLAGLVAVAMTAAFSAIVRSPVTGIVLLVEMTGELELILLMALAALVAYITADLLGAEPIYEQLLHRMLEKREQEVTLHSGKNVTFEVPVEIGSRACGRSIKEMDMPDECLIVSLRRGSREVVPGGDTQIEPLDVLIVHCSSKQFPRAHSSLENLCRARL